MSLERGQKFLSLLAETKHELPFSPKLLQRLFAQTQEGSIASLGEIANTISPDQGLTSRILAVANSAFYGLQQQVTSVQRAATVLGLKEIRNIVLALGVQGMVRGRTLPVDFDLVTYWRHQLTVALTVKLLAQETRYPDPDNLFTAGLLHDLGKMIVAMHAPEDWAAIAALRREKGMAFHKAEDAWWGIEHGVVGALVLKSWNLPLDLHEPVNWHHAPLAAPDHRTQSKLLCLADMLVNLHYESNRVSEKAVDALAANLAIPPDKARELTAQAAADEGIGQFISEVLR